MTHNYLTIHSLTALPMHNLNRDENGAPKQVFEGGVTRARLSSQSLKRAARVQFERTLAEGERSLRSKFHTDSIVQEILDLDGKDTPTRRKQLTEAISKRLAALTTKPKAAAAETNGDSASKTNRSEEGIAWLSPRERANLVRAFSTAQHATPAFGPGDSLAISAFGRMLANEPSLNIDAAVMVSPATTTHEASIELDYFTAVDDVTESTGAAHLDYAMYTSGVYYRSVTIDRRQLHANYDGDPAPLRDLIRALVLALPQGKRTSTAADTAPALILAEQQGSRTAYSFQTPVEAAADGGFLQPSEGALLDYAARARAFDPEQFGLTFLSGLSAPSHADSAEALGAQSGNLTELTDFILTWVTER